MRRLCPRRLGSLVQANARRLLLFLSLALLALCAAINSARRDAELANWVQRTSRIERELHTIETALGDGAGTNSLLILQVPRHPHQPAGLLSVDSLMIHLEAVAIATHVTIEQFDISWSLKDICFTPTPPDYEGLLVNQMLDHLMPCAIKTPLDCFWEGAKLLGPEHDVRLSSIGPKLKWTSLNPKLMVEAKQRDHPHASFPYATLLDWMQRVGITTGYLEKPCLDPTDPNCPTSAPNKLTGEPPNIGAQLTGGCHGLAEKQMHWKEDELLGEVTRNRSGHIIGAEALQSTIQLMGERDMYDYWRKTSKVQDINNWSTEKAKLVLDAWQRRFKEELDQFTRTSVHSNSYKIYAMTPKSMLEPIDINSITDLTNLKIAFALMTLFTCISYPNFTFDKTTFASGRGNDGFKNDNAQILTKVTISRFKVILLAISTSLLIGLTFIASLGLSSFMNLPYNIATIQILPPLALYYGFKQALVIANIYSQNFNRVPLDELTTECLNELLPITVIESLTYIIPLIVATAIPVPATRVFTYQAMTYIVLATLTAVLLIPSLLTTFLLYHSTTKLDCERPEPMESQVIKLKSSSDSSNKQLSIKSKKSTRCTSTDDFSLEDQIFSRIQDDLKNIKADTRQPTDINFSAHLGPDGFRTNFRLTATQRPSCNLSAIQTPNDPVVKPEFEKQFTNSDSKNQEAAPHLPDLVLWPKPRSSSAVETDNNLVTNCEKNSDERGQVDHDKSHTGKQNDFLAKYSKTLTTNRFLQAAVFLVRVTVLAAILSQSSNVRCGLQLRDIIIRGTTEYDSFLVQEKYFPIYNIFAITRGNFDYPTNQRLMYEFYKRIEGVDGIVKGADASRPKFWLPYFRDWLLELQNKFDLDRNRSAISNEGWTQEASDASKLAYKLLAQTGKIDNPIDKGQVETNRLVDKNGIINQKAFYYYLTAWVMNDAFSYSNSEANFKPEPKTWNENPDDLRIERARPLTYAQIPFLVKLPADHNSLKTITEIRSISQAFEQLNLPNFPTGIPFIYWDQFINLDLLFFASVAIITASLYLIIGLVASDFILAAIIITPIIVTLLELYGIMGFMSIPFNNIVAVLVIGTIGTTAVQTIHYTTYFENKDGDLITRASESLEQRFRTVVTSLLLFLICVLVFSSSKIDFMTRYSWLLLSVAAINAYNSLLITPIILRIFGPEYTPEAPVKSSNCKREYTWNAPCPREPKYRPYKKQTKKRSFPRVQSEISLSTISEEPQSEIRMHDLKLDLSIRCY